MSEIKKFFSKTLCLWTVGTKTIRSFLIVFLYTVYLSNASAFVISEPTFEDFIEISTPPSFVVADYGLRYDLQASFFSFSYPIIVIPDDANDYGVVPVNFEYDYEIVNGPDGLLITDEGVIEWCPDSSEIGNEATLTVKISVSREGDEIFSDSFSFNFQILADIPSLVLDVSDSFGSYGSTFALKQMNDLKFEPSLDEKDREHFQWSLIGPKTGVTISETGSINWPFDEVHSGFTEFPTRVRIDYETPKGVLSKELSLTQILLPASPTQSSLETWKENGVEAGSNLGFSMAHDGDLFIAGEPSRFGSDLLTSQGRVFIASFDVARNQVIDKKLLLSELGENGDAFGASVAIFKAEERQGSIAVVGAPEANFNDENVYENCGRVEIFELAETDIWQSVATIYPQSPKAEQYFGGWVDIDENTMITSLEGADKSGPFTGSIEIYERDEVSGVWSFSQTLLAPDGESYDYFGWPCAIDSDWVAVAANEDDEMGLNAGAVHMFERTEAGFVHRQKLLGNQAASLFGERLNLSGEWLFVSAFRENSDKGAVYIYKLIEGSWIFQQRLEGPFTEVGSAFGLGLDSLEDTLAISAPALELRDGQNEYAWDGISLYRLIEGQWEWHMHVPCDRSRDDAWGYSLTQVSREHTIVGAPFTNLNQGRSFAGIIQKLDWPSTSMEEEFATYLDELAELGLDNSFAGDIDGNGIPNILQWAMGENMAQAHYIWAEYPDVSAPRIRELSEEGMRFYMLPVERGSFLNMKVMISSDCQNWSESTDARWEALKMNDLRSKNGSLWGTYLQPILIPWPDARGENLFIRLQID